MRKARALWLIVAMALAPRVASAQTTRSKSPPGTGVESPRPDVDLGPREPLPPRKVRIPYAPGDPVPEGFAVERGFNSGVFAAGVAILGFSYAMSVLLAATDVRLTESGTESSEDGVNANLYAPILGPWSAIARQERPASEVAVLVIDGVMQAGGLTLMAIGLGTEKAWLVRVGSGVALQTNF